MDFRARLQKATERGQRARRARAREEAAHALSEEECKRLHSRCRTVVGERIESCLQQLADQFPGFHFESVMSDKGWGGSVRRDDIGRNERGRPDNFYSRLELVVSPYSPYHILELVAKGIVRNKEVFNRNTFQMLDEVDLESFTGMVDLWVLEFAERFAADGW